MTQTKTFKKLKELLTEENIINSIAAYDEKLKNRSKNNSDKKGWYALSYPVILRRFFETRSFKDEMVWIERVALLSSWLPTIPNPSLNKEAIEDMAYLENIFYNARIETIGVESFLSEINTAHHGEMIFDTSENRPPVLIKSFLEIADKITNLNGRWKGTLSTTTKLLHFMCPHLFPIFDKKISNVLFAGKQTPKNYHNYIFALHEFLHNRSECELIAKIAKDKDVSVIRLVDTVLFNQID